MSAPGSPNIRIAANMVTLPPGTISTRLRRHLDAEAAMDVGGDRLAQRQDAGRRRVAVVAVAERLDRRLDDMVGGAEVGLADAEVDDVAAFGGKAVARASTAKAFSSPIRPKPGRAALPDPFSYVVIDSGKGTAEGILALLEIRPAMRVIEMGSIIYGRALQRTPAATEAQYLMARYAFEELGYRRYEWKCDALNGRSRRAAQRLGFTFEGIFRQHRIVKGRNRDTAWFAILDGEWPARKLAFERWLDPENFDADGRQLVGLSSLNGADPVGPPVKVLRLRPRSARIDGGLAWSKS
jgi:RimJ/RimL family protein N-acetyltransferase